MRSRADIFKNRRGFTLMELMVVVALMTVMMAGVFKAVLTVMRNDMKTSAKSELYMEALKTMNRIESGDRGLYGLIKARNASVVIGAGGTSINYSVDKNATYTSSTADDTAVRIYVSDVDGVPATITDDMVMLDPDTAVLNDTISLGDGVSGLTFTQTGRVIKVAFTLQRVVRGVTYKTNVTQDIYLRN
jgi:prepilin-type N-terminal cleavage/methylation domain-containing protein